MALKRLGRPTKLCTHDDATVAQELAHLTVHNTVPVLVDGDLVMTDSSIMFEFLDETSGVLWPSEAHDRARDREAALLLDRLLGPPARDLIFESRKANEEQRDKALMADAIVRWHQALKRLDQVLDMSTPTRQQRGIVDYVAASRFALGGAYGMPMDSASPRQLRWIYQVLAYPEVTETAPTIVKRWLGMSGGNAAP